MGVWGPGNFTNDEALDWLSEEVMPFFSRQMMKVLNNPHLAEADEPDSARIMAAVDLMAWLAEQYGAEPPHSGAIEQCKATYLEVWEGYIDKLGPTPEFKKERRKVIGETFDRLIHAAEKREQRNE